MKKLVIKIGRNIATSKRNKIDRYRFEHLAKQIKLLREHDMAVVLVVSAAVCCGEQELGLKGQYSLSKSLVAGVGQTILMTDLYSIFVKHTLPIGQLLLTKSDVEDMEKRVHLQTVISQALEQNITLIVNENDIVQLHSFDGNDYLATEIAELIRADTLVLLTDVEGVLNKKMQLVREYSNTETLAQIVKVNYKGEVGGIKAKLDAALKAAKSGVTTWIVSGRTKDLFTRMFLQNEHIGTKVLGGAV